MICPYPLTNDNQKLNIQLFKFSYLSLVLCRQQYNIKKGGAITPLGNGIVFKVLLGQCDELIEIGRLCSKMAMAPHSDGEG